MRPAHYAVIRFIPDPGRNEALNVGILLWDQRNCRLRIEDAAVARVIRENPWLERDALIYLEPMLHRRLETLKGSDLNESIPALLGEERGFPMETTEPRFTTLDDSPLALDTTLERLIERIVRPRRRASGGGPNAVQILERSLRPLIRRQAVLPNYVFEDSRSGVPRTVDFFANSGANVALDTVRLSVTRAQEIRTRADAEAFKIQDIKARGKIRFLVYCDFSPAEELEEVNNSARRVIESTGAKVVTEIEAAAAQVHKAVAGHSPR